VQAQPAKVLLIDGRTAPTKRLSTQLRLRMPTDAVCGTDPGILTILGGTSFPRGADIRSGIEAYSRNVPLRVSSIIETEWLGLGDRHGEHMTRN
jgi:hypothetical protein